MKLIDKNTGAIVAVVPNGLTAAQAAEAFGVSLDDVHVALSAAETRAHLRGRIEQEAGDTLSLLGTVSDAASFSLLMNLAHTVAVQQANGDFAVYSATYPQMLQGLSEADVMTEAAAFMGRVAAGEVVLPPIAKGLAEVIEDVARRGNIVTAAIADHRAQAAEQEAPTP